MQRQQFPIHTSKGQDIHVYRLPSYHKQGLDKQNI
jgi:hypothetical protein